MGLVGNVPAREGLGQFGLPTFALVEKANSGIRPVPVGPNQQLFQRRQGAGSDHVGANRRDGFDSADKDSRLLLEGHAAGRLAQEGGLTSIRFDQGDVEIGLQGRENQARQACARPQIGQAFRPGGDQRGDLGGVDDMAGPGIGEGGRPDQVDGLLPLGQGFEIGSDARQCFT